MSNEIIFLLHILVNIFFLLLSLRCGKLYLTLFYAMQIVMANFFILKEITLFSLDVTASDVFAIGALLSLNLLREYFGIETAKKTIWLGFLACLLFMVMGQIHLKYMANLSDQTSSAYQKLLALNPRISLASVATFLIVQKFDLLIYQGLKKSLKRSIGTTMFLSLAMSNLIDTALFSLLGLYGLVKSILPIMVVAYVIKIIITVISTPFIGLTKKIIKNHAVQI